MLGTIVNVLAILVGGVFGLLFKKGISDKMGDSLMKGIGLCILFIGIQGALVGKNALVLIISLVIGTLIGEGLDLDKRLNNLGDSIQNKLVRGDEESSVAEGFVTASLLYCVGAMAVVGSLESGISGNHDILFTKSLLDGITAVILTSQLGFGVMLSALPVLLYQGAITLMSQWISPYLSELVVGEMSCVGFVIIIAIGTNMIKITKLKVMNYVPAIAVNAIMVIIVEKIPVIYNFLY